MNLQSVKTLEDCNHKRPNITIKTDEYYHVYNYNKAINSQIYKFGWDKTRLFKPVTKDIFNFTLIKYNYSSGKYYRYFTKHDIKHFESLEITKKNEIFSPKPVKKLEIEKQNRKQKNKKTKIKIKIKIKKRLFCCSIQ